MIHLWPELINKMKEILIRISQISKYHEISIINFSSTAIIECRNKDPNTYNMHELTFNGSGTSFKNAFSKAFELLTEQMIKRKKKQILIFMSDGKDEYPEKEISLLQHVEFEFYCISLVEKNNIMKKISDKLKGNMQFAENPEKYKKICFEILENPDIIYKK